MNEELYKVVKDYIYLSRKSGIKVNAEKNTVTVYASTSALYWIFGIIFLAIGAVLVTHAETAVIGIVGFLIGVAFLGGLTKRTVFDIGKNEVRKELFFIAMESIKHDKIANYHTTVVYINGRLAGYNFDMEYYGSNDQYGVGHKTMLKGIASFKNLAELHDFQGVVTAILTEMRKSNNS